MSSAPQPDPDALSADELKRLVARLLARVAALGEENRRLREENARLEDLPRRPKLAPGGMDRATGPAGGAGARRGRRPGRGGRRTPPATEERVLTVAAPPGSRRKGYQPYTVQDLVLAPRVIRYRRERWVTPDGRELVAPLPPEVAGHFGPGVVRYVLMQHVQGQVTVERLLVQLRALGICIAKGQLVALLSARKDAFHAETDAILEAGLATARWVTVDDTGARHAGRDQHTTHVGDDRFAWFATRPSKSRLNFLELLRAGRPDYVLNAAAVAYMLEHGVPETVTATLLAHERRSFADKAAWHAHLGAFRLGARQRRRVTEAAVVGAIVARGLLTDTAIVSDDAGRFDVPTHALCWVHAERHLRRLVCATAEQRRLVDLQRQLVWFSNRAPSVNPSSRSPHPSLARHHPTDPVSGPATPWCTDQRDGRTDPHPRPGSRDADGLRAPELQHPVQGTSGDGDLGRSAAVRARPERVADHPLVAGDRRLGRRATVVPRGLLPAHAPALGGGPQVPVALRRRGL